MKQESVMMSIKCYIIYRCTLFVAWCWWLNVSYLCSRVTDIYSLIFDFFFYYYCKSCALPSPYLPLLLQNFLVTAGWRDVQKGPCFHPWEPSSWEEAQERSQEEEVCFQAFIIYSDFFLKAALPTDRRGIDIAMKLDSVGVL